VSPIRLFVQPRLLYDDAWWLWSAYVYRHSLFQYWMLYLLTGALSLLLFTIRIWFVCAKIIQLSIVFLVRSISENKPSTVHSGCTEWYIYICHSLDFICVRRVSYCSISSVSSSWTPECTIINEHAHRWYDKFCRRANPKKHRTKWYKHKHSASSRSD
jgi:hypothetical protein